MYIFSGVLNVISALLMIWWAFGALNNVLLLIPALILFIVGFSCIVRAVKDNNKRL